MIARATLRSWREEQVNLINTYQILFNELVWVTLFLYLNFIIAQVYKSCKIAFQIIEYTVFTGARSIYTLYIPVNQSINSSDASLPPEASPKGVATANGSPPLPIHALPFCPL